MKKILIISTSLRVNSNSYILSKAFANGAIDAGHEVNFINLIEKQINFCKGCLACQRNHQCIIHDDVASIISQIQTSDVIVFASPIYYYEMAGQMKTLLDRCNPLFGCVNQFEDIYFIASAADNNIKTMEQAVNGLNGWIKCFEGVKLKGVIRGLGLNNQSDVLAAPSLLDEAYKLGEKV